MGSGAGVITRLALAVTVVATASDDVAHSHPDARATHDLHAELTAQLLHFHRVRAQPARADVHADAASLAHTDYLWHRYAAHHPALDPRDARARAAFFHSARRIVELDASDAAGARYGFTHLAALDAEGFAARLASWRPLPLHHPANNASALPRLAARAPRGALDRVGGLVGAGSVPASFDWFGRGVLTPVKDQRDCGACWSFTTVQTIESAAAVMGGALAPLSAQQLLDCDTSWNQGCVGGNVAAAVGYLRKFGSMRADDYPYHNADGELCQYVPELVALRVGELIRIPPGSELQLQHALLQYGPLAVSVDASGWQHYTGGIISACGDGGVNHAVQLVGWGTASGGVDYWNIRNSWSTAWGELGYARMLRGVGCNGIVDEPAYTFAIMGQECVALDCGRCVADTQRCGWCAGAMRCYERAAGEAMCARGWLDAKCPPTPTVPSALHALTCGLAAAEATGQPPAYFSLRLDRTDWRNGTACLLGFEMNVLQALGVLLAALTLLCWGVQSLCALCWRPRSRRPSPRASRRASGAADMLTGSAAAPLLGGARPDVPPRSDRSEQQPQRIVSLPGTDYVVDAHTQRVYIRHTAAAGGARGGTAPLRPVPVRKAAVSTGDAGPQDRPPPS